MSMERLFGRKNKKLQWVQFEKIIQFIIGKYAFEVKNTNMPCLRHAPKRLHHLLFITHELLHTTTMEILFLSFYGKLKKKEYIILLTQSRQEVLLSNSSRHTNSQNKPEFRTHNMALVLQRYFFFFFVNSRNFIKKKSYKDNSLTYIR